MDNCGIGGRTQRKGIGTAPDRNRRRLPRNETYREAEVFPIAFAVQNMTTIRELNETLQPLWGIHPLNDGWSPAGLYSDEGYIIMLWPNEPRTGPGLFVVVSNVTK